MTPALSSSLLAAYQVGFQSFAFAFCWCAHLTSACVDTICSPHLSRGRFLDDQDDVNVMGVPDGDSHTCFIIRSSRRT